MSRSLLSTTRPVVMSVKLLWTALLRRSRMALVQGSDGVVLPRRPGRRDPGPRQEAQEMVGAAALQRPALERLHASRRLAAARRQNKDKDQHQPPRPRQWPPPPPATTTSCFETARGHLCTTSSTGRREEVGRTATPAASMEEGGESQLWWLCAKW